MASGAVTGVYVAMDRDFDHLLGLAIKSPKVLYTFGYSWENDVWRQEVLEEVFYMVCGVCRNTIKVNEVLANAFSDFKRDMRRVTYADFLCVKHGIAFVPRQSPQKVLLVARGVVPALNKEALRQCMRTVKAQRTGAITAGSKVRTDPLTDCCGHLIGAFGYSLLMYLFRKFCKGTTYPRHLIDAIAIDRLFDRIRQGNLEALRFHYQQQLTA